jgi:hypothetical protein
VCLAVGAAGFVARESYRPSCNVAPTSHIAVIRSRKQRAAEAKEGKEAKSSAAKAPKSSKKGKSTPKNDTPKDKVEFKRARSMRF